MSLVPGPVAGARIRLDAVMSSDMEAPLLSEIATKAGARVISIDGILEIATDEDAALVRSNNRTVRVDIRKIDAMLGAVGELSLLAAGVAAAAETLGELGQAEQAKRLWADGQRLDERIAELQHGLIGIRMISLGPMLARLGRVARRVAQSSGKRVNFGVSGASTEVDKVIVEELAEPLLHLVRNAIDHGIESTAERIACGKPEEGTVSIEARQEGGQLVVDLSDDGHGIDREAIVEAAIGRGLFRREARAELNDREVLDLLFEPGFSTRRFADLVSGRGVGLDAVRERIGRLGGVIGLTSTPGSGACFSIRVPITLAMVHAILVRVGPHLLALPISGVIESAVVSAADLSGSEPCQRMTLRRQEIAVARVADLLGVPGKRSSRETVVLGGVGSSRIGLLVDEMVGARDIVVKPLPPCMESARGLAGASELGNRETVLVLDVPVLLERARQRQTNAGFPTGDLPSGPEGEIDV